MRRGERTSNIQHPTPNIQHPTSNIQHPTSNIQHPTSNIQHPTSNIQHPTSNNPTIQQSNIQYPASRWSVCGWEARGPGIKHGVAVHPVHRVTKEIDGVPQTKFALDVF